MIAIKAFIYRFSNIFGLNIFLAKKEQAKYLGSIGKPMSRLDINLHIGLWQAENKFTTVWTYKMPFHKALFAKIKHAFDFRSFE